MIISWHIKVTTAKLWWLWIQPYTFYKKLWRTVCCKNQERKWRDCIEIRRLHTIECYMVSKTDPNPISIRTDTSNSTYLFVCSWVPTVCEGMRDGQAPTSCSEWTGTILRTSGIVTVPTMGEQATFQALWGHYLLLPNVRNALWICHI